MRNTIRNSFIIFVFIYYAFILMIIPMIIGFIPLFLSYYLDNEMYLYGTFLSMPIGLMIGFNMIKRSVEDGFIGYLLGKIR